MRNIFLACCILFSLSLFSQASLTKPEFYVGASFGVTESQVRFVPTVDQNFIQGFNGGAIFRYIGDKNVGVQAEFNFSQRGWKESTGLFTKQLNYVEVPFLTHIYIGKVNRFFINLGSKVGYLISEKTVLNATVNSTEGQHITNIQHPFDYGICAGLGFQTRIAGQILALEARGYFGLSDIYNNKKSDYFDASDHVNLALNFSWLLPIKK